MLKRYNCPPKHTRLTAQANMHAPHVHFILSQPTLHESYAKATSAIRIKSCEDAILDDTRIAHTQTLHDFAHATANVGIEDVLVKLADGKVKFAIAMAAEALETVILGLRIINMKSSGGVSVASLVNYRWWVAIAKAFCCIVSGSPAIVH